MAEQMSAQPDRLAAALAWCRRRAAERQAAKGSRREGKWVGGINSGGSLPNTSLSLLNVTMKRHHLVKTLCLIGLLGTSLGCESASAKQQRLAWDTICQYAPHVGGQEIGILEQRAMDTVKAWDMSVEAVDAYCEKR